MTVLQQYYYIYNNIYNMKKIVKTGFSQHNFCRLLQKKDLALCIPVHHIHRKIVVATKMTEGVPF